jgi:hypothetical protein
VVLALAGVVAAAPPARPATGGPLLVADIGQLVADEQMAYAALEGIVNLRPSAPWAGTVRSNRRPGPPGASRWAW